MFNLARFWRMSPSEIDDLPISSVIEYCEQTQRIIDEETKAWQTKRRP